MGAVKLDRRKVEPRGAARAIGEGLAQRSRPSRSSSSGGFSPSRNGSGDGATVFQPFGSSGAICSPPFHGIFGRGLAPGMARAGSRSACRTSGARSRARAPSLPRWHRTRGRYRHSDAAFGRDRGRLDRQQRGAGQRQMAEMDHMPVGHAAVFGRILAHRRDDDAVGEAQAADVEWGEQSGHGVPYCGEGQGRLADGLHQQLVGAQPSLMIVNLRGDHQLVGAGARDERRNLLARSLAACRSPSTERTPAKDRAGFERKLVGKAPPSAAGTASGARCATQRTPAGPRSRADRASSSLSATKALKPSIT